ncbi:hypothetical protein CDAR_43681 [Caerostris darwini]|uniref:Uncharacterized protein n=1 Tax=Caerostris darwini TaxID=1538125 RepID=A0AAV4WHW3_9ARAC|nr:hypothetical protein CDAR_43681 [Caerostris darwini]
MRTLRWNPYITLYLSSSFCKSGIKTSQINRSPQSGISFECTTGPRMTKKLSWAYRTTSRVKEHKLNERIKSLPAVKSDLFPSCALVFQASGLLGGFNCRGWPKDEVHGPFRTGRCDLMSQ